LGSLIPDHTLKCEFYARSFIDQFVLYLSELPGERIRFFQGYTVSAASQKSDNTLKEKVSNPELKAQLENPVALTHNNFSLTVTGHVDYAIYTMPGKEEINFSMCNTFWSYVLSDRIGYRWRSG
jgi:hypothetical protein